MDPFGVKANLCALSVATFLSARAVRRQTLTRSGAIAGFCVGYLIVATGLRGMVLFFFYQLGSWATKYKKQRKALLDATAALHSVRGANQVLAVSVLATILSLVHAIYYGRERPIDFQNCWHESCLTTAVLAHHSTSLADTWASELGMLTNATPILITQPWKYVPSGTNGGITTVGTLWSLVGGAVIGLLTVAMDVLSGNLLSLPVPDVHALRVIGFGGMCGFVGSIVDSILGATVQATYFDKDGKQIVVESRQQQQERPCRPNTASRQHVSGLDLLTNEQVNFVSTAITTVLGGWVLGPWFFQ